MGAKNQLKDVPCTTVIWLVFQIPNSVQRSKRPKVTKDTPEPVREKVQRQCDPLHAPHTRCQSQAGKEGPSAV